MSMNMNRKTMNKMFQDELLKMNPKLKNKTNHKRFENQIWKEWFKNGDEENVDEEWNNYFYLIHYYLETYFPFLEVDKRRPIPTSTELEEWLNQ